MEVIDMSKYNIIALILAVSLLFGIPCQVSADTYPDIRIDGELRNMNPPAVITAGRTMVPIRFIVEDEALKGQVYWDGKLQKVALDCRGKYIEFYIGSRTATVDGETCYFDAPPYIYQDRTYVPLRFLAETLGAVVAWNGQKQEVDIQFNHRPEVFAYYYYTPRAELEENAHLFSDIAFRWFAVNSSGDLYYEYKDDYYRLLEYARQNNIRTHASVVLMGRQPLHELLSNQSRRQLLIRNLVEVVKRDGYDGVNIDFEFIAAADAAYFTNFLQELKKALGGNKTLSVAVFARTGQENWQNGYQYDKIGAVADRVVVMAYDYHYKTSAPGAVAPLWWVEQVTDYMVKQIPREKILLGMPTYGYDWPEGENATTVTASKLSGLISKYGGSVHFDYSNMSPCFSYYDESGRFHQVWLENQQSLDEKWNVAVEHGLGGISFWRIGNGFSDLYAVLNKNL